MKRYWPVTILLGVSLLWYSEYRLYRRTHPRAEAAASVPNTTVQMVSGISAASAPLVVKDPADQALIKQLLAENAKYKLTNNVLAVSRGTYISDGTLTVTPAPYVVESAPAPGIERGVQIDGTSPTTSETSDFRLRVRNDGEGHVSYTLTQKFLVLNTSGRDQRGTPISRVKLFVVGPGDVRNEIPVETAEVVVDETVPRWLLGFNVQGGVAATSGHATGYVAGLQWLVRGRANTPKDLKLALLTPVGFFAPNVHDIGLLPVSFNVANLVPHQPLTNVWLSPLLTFNVTPGAATVKRVGVAVTATF